MHRGGFIAATMAASLAASAYAQTNATLSLQVSGQPRSCVIHVPAGISKPAVVFFVHGANGSGSAFRNETKGDVTADREKFIAVYPSASATGATGTWADMQGTGNFPFFQAVLDTLAARYQIDRNRVYMTGFSQGGFISFAAGCFFSDVFAAVAPVSGHSMTTCTLKRPVPIFMTFGVGEGPAKFLTDTDFWLKQNKCPSTPPMLTRPYPASNPNSKVGRVSYGPCEGGSSVVMDSISGQGHQWPSSSNLVQADEVWAFFKQYSLGGATGTHPQSPDQNFGRISASYASGRVSLEGVGEGSRVRVSDIHGKLVATATSAHRQFAFPDKPSGLYVVTVDGTDGARKFLVP